MTLKSILPSVSLERSTWHQKHLWIIAERRIGKDRLGFFEKDRLVLPYRVPLPAIVMVFLFKAARDTARGRVGSAVRCLLAPPLLLLNFVNAVSGDRLLKKVW